MRAEAGKLSGFRMISDAVKYSHRCARTLPGNGHVSWMRVSTSRAASRHHRRGIAATSKAICFSGALQKAAVAAREIELLLPPRSSTLILQLGNAHPKYLSAKQFRSREHQEEDKIPSWLERIGDQHRQELHKLPSKGKYI